MSFNFYILTLHVIFILSGLHVIFVSKVGELVTLDKGFNF